MSYPVKIPIPAQEAGLTWTVQLVDNNGVDVGGPINEGFTPNGEDYLWEYDEVPDSLTLGHAYFTCVEDPTIQLQAPVYPSAGGDGSSGDSIVQIDETSVFIEES